MQFSSLAKDLFDPGHAENFFEISGLSDFDPTASGAFTKTNALWLAEFSRLIYREWKSDTRTGRDGILQARAPGWRSLSSGGTTASRFDCFFHAERTCACLVFRGTLGLRDLLTDAQIVAVPWKGPGHIHRGFKLEFDALWPEIERTVRSLDCPVFLAGHSLGGALATLAAARILQHSELAPPAGVYTFGSPRVGDAGFAKAVAPVFHCRIVHSDDVVATVPPPFSLRSFPIYQHTGSLHHLRDGALHTLGADPTDGHPPGTIIRNLALHARETLTGTTVLSGTIPSTLMAHAPVNYVAALEALRAM